MQGTTTRMGIPKGRMYDGVVRVLEDAGLRIRTTSRDYRPDVGLDGLEAKILKPRAIVEMLDAGMRDVGFAGADWVAESKADLVELVDTGLDTVRLVAAAPATIIEGGRLPDRPLVVATEYVELGRAWIAAQGIEATLLRSYGATEVLPPEDADCIIDNTASGATLEANGLRIVDTLMTSSTRLYASPRALDDPARAETIGRLSMLVRSVLEARTRVMVELNVGSDNLQSLIEALPCMREPTISPLHADGGFAVKAAVPRRDLVGVIPMIKARGGTDIVVTTPGQIVL